MVTNKNNITLYRLARLIHADAALKRLKILIEDLLLISFCLSYSNLNINNTIVRLIIQIRNDPLYMSDYQNINFCSLKLPSYILKLNCNIGGLELLS
jgi:hypothetical protein